MRRNVFFTLLMVALLGLAGSGGDALAQGSGHKHGSEGGPEKVTIVGEVIDPVCYIRHDSKGMEHKKCAEYCAKLGITLAILNEKDDEVLLAFPEGHTDPNEKLVAYIAQRVKVTGIIHERGGLKGIEVVSIEPAKLNVGGLSPVVFGCQTCENP